MATVGSLQKSTPSSIPGAYPLNASEHLKELVSPHIESFNYQKKKKSNINTKKHNTRADSSSSSGSSNDSLDSRCFPAECRQLGTTYDAPLWLTICRRVNNGTVIRMQQKVGDIPIMVQLVRRHEDADEFGGYFVCNGIERCIRMLQIPRRNMVQSLDRPSFANRGPKYSSKATSIRSVTADQSGTTVTCHYQTDGNVMVRFLVRKQEFFVPVILLMRALKEVTDREIYDRLSSSFVADHVEVILRDGRTYGDMYSRTQCLAYLGARFRVLLQQGLSCELMSDAQVGRALLHRHIFVHLSHAKFSLLLFMLRKLFSFVEGTSVADNSDALSSHEILTSDRQKDLGKELYYFLATGNLRSTSGLDLMQNSGFTIIAEKLNWLRYIAHFRSVRRFFAEMKTTTVRKLLPESWGFLCCVHTPDGSPCGLLSHLCAAARIVPQAQDTSRLPSVLVALGMIPDVEDTRLLLPRKGYLPVLLDGRVIGAVAVGRATKMVSELRRIKVTELASRVPVDLECALVLPMSAEGGGPFPGLYLAAEAARLVRPVHHLGANAPEWIGTFEQMFMSIGFASLTPFSDMNQSPRNMYQCQMGKQTMGTPCHNWINRRDNKMYRIQHAQAPIVQNKAQVHYRIDDHSNGCNAVVAVLSYTGYDMEDAMIIGKGSYDRGFGHASVYKVKTVDLCEREANPKERFGVEVPVEGNVRQQQGAENIDSDGLPRVGTRLVKGDAMYLYKDNEPCVLRYNRNPVVGDKFSSRHGQKGVLSFLYPQQDMPFTESGMSPDIIINPHAFPSRMTIGMLVESMAGKAGALHGHFQDSTPFRFDENHRAVDYMGEQLKAAGYNYYGSEPMYSGITGEEMQADIFIGCVYYQRLRHMVSDKSQVRSTGPMNSLTMQPVKGRKRGGGIRFGEMERDSLIAHGTSFLLQDRLCNSSDRHNAWVSIPGGKIMHETAQNALQCRSCNSKNIKQTSMPYVVRYLANELAAMNIRMGVEVS
eukprot:GSMAST32.ASY1.ANO1.1206.1 assembled CDS